MRNPVQPSNRISTINSPWRRHVPGGFALALLLLVLPAQSWAQKAPEGFAIDVLYQVPDVEYPSAVTCDAQGNLFIAEDPMDMRGPSTEPIDRILYVRFDKSGGPPVKTVFCENLSAVFGMVWYQDALYVIDAPHYTMLKDTDNDGIADVRKQLADGLGHSPGLFGLNNHVPSGMRIGLDGFLYVALGDKGLPKAVGADGKTLTIEGGGVFRMRPDGTQLEAISHGIRNNMDVALDRFDNIFAYDNDDDDGWWTRIIHHVPTGYYGYPYDYHGDPNRFLPAMNNLEGGTPCGGACYREAAWPKQYRGNAFFCQWGESKIERFSFRKKGATFECEVDDFIASDGSGDFRPIDLCFSPDGKNMYIADWNLAGGGKKDRVGRVFRVSYTGGDVPAEPPRATNDAPLQAQLKALAHPAHFERLRAQQRLADIGRDAVKPVSELLNSNAAPLIKVHALWTQNALIDSIKNYDPHAQWIDALSDADADVRTQAARALGLRRVASALPALTKSLEDSDAAVRMRAAVALGRIGKTESAQPLLAAIDDEDTVARYAIMQALRAINHWEPALRHLKSANPNSQAATLVALSGVYDPQAIDVLNAWFRQADDSSQRVAALHALAEVHRKADPYTGGWWGGKAAKGKPVRPKEHEWAGTKLVMQALRDGLQQKSAQVRSAALTALHDVPAPAAQPIVRRLVHDDDDPQVRREAIALLSLQQDTESLADLLTIAGDDDEQTDLREHALQAISTIGAKPVGKQLVTIAQADNLPTTLAGTLFSAVAQLETPHAKETIETRLNDPRAGIRAAAISAYAHVKGASGKRLLGELEAPDASVRRAALQALGQLREQSAIPAMIVAAGDEAVQLAAMSALNDVPDRRAIAVYLAGLQHENTDLQAGSRRALMRLGATIADDIRMLEKRNELSAPLRSELAKVFAKGGKAFAFLRQNEAKKLDPAAYVAFAAENAGDAARGQKLFADENGIGCAKCHAVGGKSSKLGPDLLGVGLKYPRRELIRSVLEPSNRILTDYDLTVVLTSSGKVYQGIVTGVSPKQLDLVDAEGKTVSIPADDIEEKQPSPLSPMPNGLADGMSLQDFSDIIAYLQSLKQQGAATGGQ